MNSEKVNIKWTKKVFHFKVPSGTSRGVLTEKHSWFLEVNYTHNTTVKGIGECSVIPGLSPDFVDFNQYESQLNLLVENPTIDLTEFPSIRFGLETALLDLQNGGKGIYFDNEFTKGQKKIPINGLIWMGSKDFMENQIEEKIKAGFDTLKMKIGAIDFDSEIDIIKSIRDQYKKEKLELRVDANGAFSSEEALSKLNRLKEFHIHSIEQPIKANQQNEMRKLCLETPIDIALDEELIGVNSYSKKKELLKTICPKYIILKPSLHGGISGTTEWIEIAEKLGIRWWLTSALESNIGLMAICQFSAEFKNDLLQGLGTGSLYTDNIPSDLTVENGTIFIKPS